MNGIGEYEKKLWQKLMFRTNGKKHFAPNNGISIKHIEKNLCVGNLKITPKVLNPMGVVHGGCLFALMDTIAGAAVCTNGYLCTTVDGSINYLRPVRSELGDAKCIASVVKMGKTLSVCQAQILDYENNLLCTGSFTFFILDKKIKVD